MKSFVLFLSVLYAPFAIASNNNNNANQKQFDGQQYNQNCTPQLTYALKMINEHMQPWPSEGNLLDVGCGNGAVTAIMANKHWQVKVHGLDPNKSMLQEVEKLNTSVSTLFHKNIEDMDFENKYNTITSFSTLHWCTDIKKALAAIFTALKPGGKGYFTLSAQDERKPPIIKTVLEQQPWNKLLSKEPKVTINHLRSYKPSEMQDLCTQVGFNIKKCTSEELPYTFKSTEEFCSWFAAISPYKKVFGTQHDEFVKHIVNNYGEYATKQYGNPLDFRNYQLFVIVEKPGYVVKKHSKTFIELKKVD